MKLLNYVCYIEFTFICGTQRQKSNKGCCLILYSAASTLQHLNILDCYFFVVSVKNQCQRTIFLSNLLFIFFCYKYILIMSWLTFSNFWFTLNYEMSEENAINRKIEWIFM